VEEARAVDAFDAGHFDVSGGAGSGYPGDEVGGSFAKVEVLGEGLDDLACMQDA
jgi:hypothetical protein